MVSAYPKSGTTWMRFILADLFTGDEVDFDSVERISPSVGWHREAPRIVPGGGRLIKSHEPLSTHRMAFPHRTIYMVRDGRDVAVSYYYHQRRAGRSRGLSFEEFLSEFLHGAVDGYGSWHRHVLSWRRLILAPDCKAALVRYEDLVQDPVATVQAACSKLGLVVDDREISRSVSANDAASMRSKEGASQYLSSSRYEALPFVRTATSGDWRSHYDSRLLQRFDEVAGVALRSAGYR